MNLEINPEEWNGFFSDLGKRRYEWTTRIEVMKSDIGDQILTEGLPLNGITLEKKDDLTMIDISVGEKSDFHLTHNIKNPNRVAFLAAADKHGDIVDIEEDDGTKTLMYFIEPVGVAVGYTEDNTAADPG